MMAFPNKIKPIWSRALVALALTALGCRASSYAQHSATSPVTSAPAAVSPPLGTSLDDIDARNRADIAAQLGRPVAPGPATPQEVAAMARAGIDSRFIICYINRSTNMAPITAQDVIYLHDQGVSEQVIQAMLTPGAADTRVEVARAMPRHIYVVEDPWWPYYYPYPRYGYAYTYGYRCY
jgi:hypothetical protein